jgi:hypothetical protein
MPLHTPQSIWAKYKQPSLEITSDGFGVCLDARNYLVIRWSAALDMEQLGKWLAFFAKLALDPSLIEGMQSTVQAGESSEVISLEELRSGLALLTSLHDK